ncbi:MAG: hypothetical protein ACI9MC_001070 [Kiritimatiellia bacterium]|jgi:hypothetical protein
MYIVLLAIAFAGTPDWSPVEPDHTLAHMAPYRARLHRLLKAKPKPVTSAQLTVRSELLTDLVQSIERDTNWDGTFEAPPRRWLQTSDGLATYVQSRSTMSIAHHGIHFEDELLGDVFIALDGQGAPTALYFEGERRSWGEACFTDLQSRSPCPPVPRPAKAAAHDRLLFMVVPADQKAHPAGPATAWTRVGASRCARSGSAWAPFLLNLPESNECRVKRQGSADVKGGEK